MNKHDIWHYGSDKDLVRYFERNVLAALSRAWDAQDRAEIVGYSNPPQGFFGVGLQIHGTFTGPNGDLFEIHSEPDEIRGLDQ